MKLLSRFASLVEQFLGAPVQVHGTLVAFVVCMVYGVTFGHEFVWDDIAHIAENPVLHSLSGIPAIMTGGDSVGTADANPYYRPLTTLTFIIDYVLWNGSPSGFHLTNVVIHASVSVLVLMCTRTMLASSGMGLVAALVFAVHPVNVEPVAYVSARADLLAAFFMLLAFLTHLRSVLPPSRGRLAAITTFYIAALLCKITAAMFPAALLVFERYCRKRQPREYLPSVTAATAAVLVFIAIRTIILDAESWTSTEPLTVRAFTAPSILMSYVGNLLAPFDLRVFYHVDFKRYFLQVDVLVPLAILITAAHICTLVIRSVPVAGFSMVWILLFLVPVSGIPGTIYPTQMADRYLYIPSIGYAILFALLTRRLSHTQLFRTKRKELLVTALACLCIFGLASSVRSLRWSSSVTLWEKAYKDEPTNRYVMNRLGIAYMRTGMYDRAETMFTDLIYFSRGNPDPVVLCNLAGVYDAKGMPDAAEATLHEALKKDPRNSSILANLALMRFKLGDPAGARTYVEASLAIHPFNMQARSLLASIVNGEAETDDADEDGMTDDDMPKHERR